VALQLEAAARCNYTKAEHCHCTTCFWFFQLMRFFVESHHTAASASSGWGIAARRVEALRGRQALRSVAISVNGPVGLKPASEECAHPRDDSVPLISVVIQRIHMANLGSKRQSETSDDRGALRSCGAT
jgi:hypothetical protein